MPTLTFEQTINAPIERVWDFLVHPSANIARVASRPEDVQVVRADEPLEEGSRIELKIRAPGGKMVDWIVRIAELRPPHPVVFGMEARMVDEQERGPLAAWRHERDLEAVDSKTTRIVEQLHYRIGFGPLGMLGDWLGVRWMIRSEMAARSRKLKELLET